MTKRCLPHVADTHNANTAQPLLQRHDIPLFTVAEVRAMENDLFASQESFAVMQNAATALFDTLTPTLQERMPATDESQQHMATAPTVHIVLGCGNNAGDGLLLASLLHGAGQSVIGYQVFDKDFHGDAEKAYQTAIQRGVQLKLFEPFQCQSNDVIVEAIFGIGLDRPITGLPHVAITHINHIKAQLPHVHVMAVDIPAGIDANTGTALGAYVHADETVTFIADKIGLHTAAGKGASGNITVSTLGAQQNLISDTSQSTPTLLYDYKQHQLNTHSNQHKGDFGHALIIGGDQGMFGATALAAVSSLKVGAGKSSIYAHADYASQYHLDSTPLYEVMRCQQLADLTPYSALILGPGLGRTTWGKNVFHSICQQFHPTLPQSHSLPLLVDADGLYHVANVGEDENESDIPHVNALLEKISVITPHEAEAAKLLNTDVNTVRDDKISAVKQLATRFSCIAVLKGAGSLISDGTHVWINQTGNINLASAGTGDVLAGMIGGYLAQGYKALDAALYGVYQHGLAADRYAEKHTGKSLRASDLWQYSNIHH